MKEKLVKHLETFISDNRRTLIHKIIDFRTRYITVVLEDIYQSQNASAVLRSCDCFGIQDVHIIENKNKYKFNPDVSLGSEKWLSLYRYSGENNNSIKAIENLKQKGYRIVATTPGENVKYLNDFDLSAGKTALLFGTELEGLSQNIIDRADEFVKIPMFGFTQSFNISVSAAISLYHLTNELRNSSIDWKLTEEEKTELKLHWYKNSIKKVSLIEKDFMSRNS
jgi:tRNA (guanosine-2'-O-)-methyltransferase